MQDTVRIPKPCAYCGELTCAYKLICMKCKNFFFRNGIESLERVFAIADHLNRQFNEIEKYENNAKVLNEFAE